MSVIAEMLPPWAGETARSKEAMPYVDWLALVRFMLDGRPFNLDLVPYMRDIYLDPSPEITCRKASQIGFTYFSVGRAAYWADQHGLRVLYYLPNDEDLKQFLPGRVKPMLTDSDYLMSRIGENNNMQLVDIGPGKIYWRGLRSPIKAKSVPVDALIFDEVDEHKPELIELSHDRVLFSDSAFMLFMSIPTFSGMGIDARFMETDQRFMHYKCPSCGEWNCLDKDFPENFRSVPTNKRKSFPEGATHYRGCRWCDAPLDMRAGEWVADYPDRKRRGYHVSQLLRVHPYPGHPNVSTWLMEEFAKSKTTTERLIRWWRAIRGMAFDGEGARITDDMLKGFETGQGFLYLGSGCVMGVDQGNAIHVSIYHVAPYGSLKLIYCERTERWGRVSELFRQFGCYAAGCDRGPDVHSARGFAAEFKGRVFLISYGNDETEKDQQGNVKRRIKEDLHEGRIPIPWVTVDRTNTLDATVDFVVGGHLMLPDREQLEGPDRLNYDEYRGHVVNLKWTKTDTPSGVRRVYLKNANHQGMGLNYGRLAAFECGIKPPAPQVDPIWMSMGMGHA